MSRQVQTPKTQQSIVQSRVQDGRLILCTSNGGYLPFLRNYLAGLRLLGISSFVVAALDDAVWDLLDALGLHGHALRFGAGQQRAEVTSWYDAAYKRLMGSHPMRVLTVLQHANFDVDLLVTDVDMVWLRSPWPVLYAADRRRCQLQGMRATSDESDEQPTSAFDVPIIVRLPHPKANCPNCINAGFLFLRRGHRTRRFVEGWTHLLDSQGRADHNQKWANFLLAGGAPMGSKEAQVALRNGSGWASGPSVCQLPPRLFANGERLRAVGLPHHPQSGCVCSPAAVGGRASACEARRNQTSSPLVAAHFNFALSAAHKTCMAKAVGAWLLSDDPRHSSAYSGHGGANQSMVKAVRRWALSAPAIGTVANWTLSAAQKIAFGEAEGQVCTTSCRP